MLVAIWVVWQGWEPGIGFNVEELLNLSLWIGMAFVCVVLHEYGHALMARRFGIATEKILIFPLGGGAFLKRMPKHPSKEILVAFAGPMVNIIMATIMAILIWWPGYEYRQDLLALLFNPYSNTLVIGSSTWDYTIIILFLFNLILAAFNLLPAYPLDGGRIFRALLKRWIGPILAQRYTALTSILFSFGFIWLAYRSEDWVLALAGGFICFVGFFEFERSRRAARLEGKMVSDFYRPILHPLYLKDTLMVARELNRKQAERYYLVLDHWHEPKGLLTQQKLLSLEDKDQDEAIDQYMDTQLDWISEEQTLSGAFAEMQNKNKEVILIRKGYRTMGILDRDKIRDILSA